MVPPVPMVLDQTSQPGLCAMPHHVGLSFLRVFYVQTNGKTMAAMANWLANWIPVAG